MKACVFFVEVVHVDVSEKEAVVPHGSCDVLCCDGDEAADGNLVNKVCRLQDKIQFHLV